METTSDQWLECTLAALRTARTGKPALVTSLWERALEAANSLPFDDPRRAAALHNVGLSHLIRNRKDEALPFFAAAMHQWITTEHWINSTDIPLSGRSTAFHLLLAANHTHALSRMRREKYLDIRAGAAAITQAIVDYLNPTLTVDEQRASLRNCRETLVSAFGAKCAEAQTLRDLASGNPMPIRAFDERFLDDRWHAVSENTAVEIRPLIDAAYLTAGLHPRHIGWIENAARTGETTSCDPPRNGNGND